MRRKNKRSPGGGEEESPPFPIPWGPLVSGTLLKRYKRFLADVELDDGRIVTAHTPNTGRMLGCSEPGRPVWLSLRPSPGRKYPYTWELIAMPESLVGVNTGAPNRLVARAAELGLMPELGHPVLVEREVLAGSSRLDLRLVYASAPEVFVEIKNCSLVENGRAFFPDAVTARGLRHLAELETLARSGTRAFLVIVVQRLDAVSFSPADHIDPQWGRTLRRALHHGVELSVWRARPSLAGLDLDRPLPVIL